MKATFEVVHAVQAPLVIGWSTPERFNLVKTWLRDLVQITNGSAPSGLTWEIIGRAVMVVNDSQVYCKKIINQIALESGYQIKEVAADQVFKLFAGGFSEIPSSTMIVTPLGIWSESAKSHESAQEIQEFQRSFAEMLAAIPADKHLLFVSYGDDPMRLVEDLRSVGAFDRRFIIDDATLQDRGLAFIELLPEHICGETLHANPELIGQVLECEADHERRAGLIALALKRLAYREARQVQYSDLLTFALHGTADYVLNTYRKKMERNVAIHEAGHALVSIVDSDGENIPDYAGIVPSVGTLGQVSTSYAYINAMPCISLYKYKRHFVRSLLAGRAAEQLILGVENISVTSAGGDLRHATDIAKNLMARAGISPTMEDETTAGSNLFVKRAPNISEAEKFRIEEASRLFLSRQYDVVLNQLRTHRKFLEAIAEHLLEARMLDRSKLKSLAIAYGALKPSPL